MSDRLTGSKWTWGGVLLLGVGTLAAAGGLALAVYYVRNRRVRVTEPPVLAVREDELSREPEVEVFNFMFSCY